MFSGVIGFENQYIAGAYDLLRDVVEQLVSFATEPHFAWSFGSWRKGSFTPFVHGKPIECNMELSAFIVYVEWLKRKPCFTPESMKVTSQCYAIGFLFLDSSSSFCRFLVDPI